MASPYTEQRVLWAFWLACGLSAIAAVVPVVLGGGSNRIGGGVMIPFVLAAVLLGACALVYRQGRSIATLLYFVASLAVVYGMLAVLTLPLRLAVIGTCPPAPAVCAAGLERPMTTGEANALGLAVGLGIVAILTGFFGLVTLYRRDAGARLPAAPPPERRIAPVGAKTPAPAATVVPEAAPLPTPAKTEAEPAPEPAAPQLELAAPVEPLELPPIGTADRVDVAPPAPQRKPRKQRAPKAPPTAPGNSGTGASA